jgi:hypothetical protein
VLYRVFGHWEKSYLNTRKKYDIFTCENIICCKTHCHGRLLFFTEFCLYNKQKNTWVLGNTRFISSVEHDISLVRCAHSWDIMFNTRNKSGISAHPCMYYSLCISFWLKMTLKSSRKCTVSNCVLFWIIYWILKMSCLFGICFLLYFFKLSAGHSFWTCFKYYM